MPSAASDLALLEAAAREAGELARSLMRQPLDIKSKGAAGPVTNVDLAVNALLEERLRGARPDYGWLSEESPDTEERLSRRRVFMIDPIDGTAAMIERKPEFTISIGVVEDGRAAAGAIYNPMTDEMFLGAPGAGASVNGRHAAASSRDELNLAHMVGMRRRFADDKWPRPWPKMQFSYRQSIAYRMAVVASGAADATILWGLKHEWDIAAGAAIVEAAGGRVSDPWGGAIVFNQAPPRAPGVVASGSSLHALIIERLQSLPDPRRRAREETAMPQKSPDRQLLHLVIGGELKALERPEFLDLSAVEFVGAYPNYRSAHDAWKAAAQRTVDNARMRFFIIHAHRLLDPEEDDEDRALAAEV